MYEQDDKALVASALSGNQAAFATLVERYQAYVFTLLRRHINDRETAEEVAQDVFVKAFRFLGTFRGDSKFSTWLYTIVHSTCFSYLRKKKHDTVLPGEEKVIWFSDNNQDSGNEAEPFDVKAQKKIIEIALQTLEAEDQEIITLYYQTGLSIEEISAVVKKSASTIKVRLFRSRQKLKEVLKHEINELR